MRTRLATYRWLLVIAAALLPLAAAGPAAAASPAPSGSAAPLTPSDVARLSADATKRSIIIFRNQHPDLPDRGANVGKRRAAITSDQQGVSRELSQLHATQRSFHTVNAVAATISQAEASRLAANPAVKAVVPDRFIPRPAPSVDATIGPAATPGGSPAALPSEGLQQLCPANPAVPQLEPEALQLTNTEQQATQPAAHDLVNGSGVTVAFIADGLDINNPDLTRNGQSIVTDYQDFSGDGINARTGGGEAFGDAASIAAQGNAVYDISQFVNPAHPLPAGCNIRIEGMAPGVNLVSLKVFGTGGAFDSTIIQAIDWAVEQDHVNVINESFGANPFPDDQNDPVQTANANAVAAGVTVVASSGDAGFSNTIGDSAGNNATIDVGATTQLRTYRQEGGFGSQLSAGGWLNDNVSAISSSGFTQLGPRTVDVLAPGDLGWSLCSTNTAMFTNCIDNNGRPSAIQIFGGTSESSPLVAGEAALIIDAYRRTHGGATPTPDLVKRIVTSTADDLDVPAQEQGAGLIDALKAVQAAMSIQDANGTPAAQGSSLLLSTSELQSTAKAGAPQTFQVDVTNTGDAAQTVTPSVRTLSSTPLATDAGTVSLNPTTSPVFFGATNAADIYALHSFSVPDGAQRLDADLAWNSLAQPNSVVRETLFDPAGRMAMYSLPQGAGGGFAHVDVRDPLAGSWTAVIWSSQTGSVFNGSVQFQFTSSAFTAFGQVSPAKRTLQPGQTGRFTVKANAPAAAGDMSASLVLNASGGAQSSVPIVLRSLVPLDNTTGGSFSGVLQGGNARSATNAQMFSFQFDVPNNRAALNLALTLRDNNYRLTGLLVSPDGEPLDVQTNGVGQFMQFFLRRPASGRWTALLRLSKGLDGTQLHEPFTGQISFDAAQVTASGVPNSRDTVLVAGQPVTATVTVTNTGNIAKSYFIDPRLNQTGTLPLLSSGFSNVRLPLVTQPRTIVPPGTNSLVVAAAADAPMTIHIQAGFGGPRRLGTTLPGNQAVATDVAPQVAPGAWFALPEEQGPFPATGATPATANMTAVASTRLFDSAVTSSTGDLWLETVDPTATATLITLAPGATGTITVTFTPNAAAGSVVQGSLEVSTFNPATLSGDQVFSVPYAYRVG